MTRLRALVALLVSASAVACGDPDTPDLGRLSVYAASSLTDAFGELEAMFETAHPGTDVSITYAGSQVLRLQIEQGAGADVFASANVEQMRALERADLVEESRVFAHNDLVIIVPEDNPARIESLEDLTHASRLVLGTANAPVGQYARQVLRQAGPTHGEGFEAMVLSRVVSEEPNSRLARAKVELGEADAAIVYRSDAGAADRVRVVPIPAEVNVVADYPIAMVSGTRAGETAQAWIEFVESPQGRSVLARHGFTAP
ncbi:MAG: molybdate ABC transporter substrate-binding protein [Gemmatimonadetes bacterium]|nr:molybdate ABC transporter substrate-binding protein [Gemmatimonadota bacterium]